MMGTHDMGWAERAIFGKIEPIVACNSALLEALRGAQVDDSGGSNSGLAKD